MPELPEVETIARRLREVVVGKTITSVEILRSKSFAGDVALAIGQQIIEVGRRSKLLWLKLQNDRNLLVHLKMTGQLLLESDRGRVGGGHPTADFTDSLPSKSTRVIIALSDRCTLFFNDQRVFGWIRVVTDEELTSAMRPLGPDAGFRNISSEYFQAKLAKTKVPIKQVIMDNAVIAGVGNIYANDALHLAKIDPRRPSSSLSATEVQRLLDAVETVIALGIETGGATIQHYRSLEGLTGNYQNHVRVYGRENQPCQDCGEPILRIKQGGRSSFYCPSCQR